jgi:hypothetical protein
MKVVVAQKGCREQYLAARALYRHGMLAGVVTDWFPPRGPWAALARRLPWRALSRAYDGYAVDFPPSLVRSFNFAALRSRRRLARAARCGALGVATFEDDVRFARRVAATRLPEHDVFLAFSYAALEALRAEKARGKLVVLDQLDPGLEEHLIIREEERRFPRLVAAPRDVPDAYYDRMKAEWAAADRIVVNSEWSRDCIVKHGAAPERIHVLPLAYESEAHAVTPRPAGRPVKALWLGRVTLQKGIQYLLQAAERLAGQPIRIRIAGAPAIRADALRDAPPNVEWLGKVTQEKALALYREADVFVLPTLSDGFAMTQLEAMAHGVPVIATTHCGRVVEDGVNGYLVPARDPDALAAALRRFADRPAARLPMVSACLATASRYTVSRYADALRAILSPR